eukprot:TRINITY_DN192_c0_g4_i1.p1 TRINITY_DN192_c0_g4~~TRINITY_DN192_c0_g4_i1.p1  ORF type:complete len:486 (+),score=49.06 TRINITY_DN192_c0_g4_i1:222-1679(+)
MSSYQVDQSPTSPAHIHAHQHHHSGSTNNQYSSSFNDQQQPQQQLGGVTLQGQGQGQVQGQVQPSQQVQQGSSSSSIQERKVFVGGLSWETTDEKLRVYFQNYGVVEDSVVIRDKQSGRPRGFGFVVFQDSAHAQKVVSLHKHTIDRREVETRLAVPRDSPELASRSGSGFLTSASAQQRKLFVGGLAPTVSERIFREYFLQYGPIEDIVVMYDHTSGRPRGFGFVTFKHEESIQRVFSQQVHAIHDKQIDVKPAVSREQMPQIAYGNVRHRIPVANGARVFQDGYNGGGGGNTPVLQDMVNMYGLGNDLGYVNQNLGAMNQVPGGFNSVNPMLNGLQGMSPGLTTGGLDNIYDGGMGAFGNQFGGHFGGQYDQYVPAIENQQLLGQNVGDGHLIAHQVNQLNGLDQLGLRMQNGEGDVDIQQLQDAQHARDESQASVELGVLNTFTSALSAQLDQLPLQSTPQNNSFASLTHQVNSLLGEENVH